MRKVTSFDTFVNLFCSFFFLLHPAHDRAAQTGAYFFFQITDLQVCINFSFQWDPSTSMRNYRRNSVAQAKLLRRYSHECIGMRYQDMSKGREVPQDILTKIIDTASRVGGMTRMDLQDEFATLFLAGQETTAASLAFLTLECGRNPHILAK